MNILERISSETGISVAFFTLVARTADHRYKEYTIPKVTGGERLIEHPAREVKFLQRWAVSRVFRHAPVHGSSTAYRQGSNVRDNASLHAEAKFFLKVDFKDFFSSIHMEDVRSLLSRMSSALSFPITDEDMNIISKVVTRHGRLPIGAPSSPVISNAVMYEFDCAMSGLAEQFLCRYSRYADDIVFSTRVPHVLENVLNEVRKCVSAQTSPTIRINESKVVFNSKKRRVRITGLIVDCKNDISVGREQKRIIKAMVHEYRLAHLSGDKTAYLKGYLSYLKSVEPKFVSALRRKYGDEVLDAIFRT
jgi:RNA-directed DNA polymerase